MSAIWFVVQSETYASYEADEQETIESVETKIVDTSPEALKSLIRHEFNGDEDMVKIAHCESGTRHFTKSGEVIRSHTNDVGIMQINVATWEKTADQMGIDIYSLDGNIEMAKHVLKVQGKTAWVCYKKIR